jgi:hypothetical protein
LLPQSSRALLLYVLDLLAVFARNSTKTLMTPSNLAVVFQPGLVRAPDSDLPTPTPGFSMSQSNLPNASDRDFATTLSNLAMEQANERKKSQEVLEFLIEHQDHFVMELKPSMLLPAPISASPTQTNYSPSSQSSTSPTSSTSPPFPLHTPNQLSNDPTSIRLVNSISTSPTKPRRLGRKSTLDNRRNSIPPPPKSGELKKSNSLRRATEGPSGMIETGKVSQRELKLWYRWQSHHELPPPRSLSPW